LIVPVRGASVDGRMARSLQLTNPLLAGPDVKEAQQLLAQSAYGDFAPGTPDGVYGPATANAAKQAKFALGYPDSAIDTVFGPKLRGYLRGDPVPADYQARRRQRQPTIDQSGSLREAIVAHARWGIANEAAIHYQQLRPMDGLAQPRKLPLQTDCSGFVTLCYKWAGAPDPNGCGFNGQGYTGTMLQRCTHISKSAAKVGDLVVWGPPPGRHVAMMIEAGPDPLLVSHGQEKGPCAVRFSAACQYQPTPVTWLTCVQ
jgi:cell wall-associated NlpC family hydrolase